ncbi:MAG: oxidoreductase [Bacteroidetes bacterium]|nr:oxidoreductase [Bacteroidota bacterium]HET6243629.1 oxidoreductase [Bacteroidia bacterium]
MKNLFFLLFILFSRILFSQELLLINTELKTSFRGLSIVDENIAWISGNNGYIGTTINAGSKWHFFQIPGYETLDFRSIYAFDENKAIVANAGSPAFIFITSNGGLTWHNVYTDQRKEIFINGITFFNEKEGIIFGDPVESRMYLLRTLNGGNDWTESPFKERPALLEGEAAFAASGTTIRSYNQNRIIIASGGIVSRLFVSKDKGKSWKVFATPILQGKSSTGIFSFDFADNKTGIIVGGDYALDTLKTNHIFLSKDAGRNWQKPITETGGYRSSVEFIDGITLIATGTSGTDISHDGGNNWRKLSQEGFHVLRKSRTGKLVILAGSEGRIAIFKNE